MHCGSSIVILGAIATVAPGLLTLYTVRVWMRAKRTSQAESGGVILSEMSHPSWIDRMVKLAVDGRDSAVLEELSGKIPSGARVLEVGCGDTQLLKKLLAHGYDAYGIDLDPVCAKEARKNNFVHRVRVGDFLTEWPGTDHFDAILFCDSIRYASFPHRVLQKALYLADLVFLTEPLPIVHVAARFALLRFLKRVGHISEISLSVLRFALHKRRYFHRLWIFDRRAKSDGLQEVLQQNAEEEFARIKGAVVHPMILSMWRRAILFSVGASVVSVISFVVLCSRNYGH